MRLKQELRELLRQGREEEAARLVTADARAVRLVVGRLWDPDAEIRGRAARTVGRAAAAHGEIGLDLIRRLMWSLNDESATNGVYAVPALGEIGHRAPDMLAPFVPGMVSLARDDGLRLELLSALLRVAEAAPHLVAAHLDELEPFIDATHGEEREAFDRLRAVAQQDPNHGN
jgi:hypothetical protein